jgi:hypothetical protein
MLVAIDIIITRIISYELTGSIYVQSPRATSYLPNSLNNIGIDKSSMVD